MQFNKTILKICLVISCLLLNISAVGLPRFDGATSFMEPEIWIDIPSYEGRYQVSNFGSVKTLAREVHDLYGRRRRDVLEKQLSLKLCGSGYLKASFNDPKIGKKGMMVHRLVAIAFIQNPHNKREVNHKDGNKLNNHVSNLEWCTPSENMRHCTDSQLRVYSPVLNTETGIFYNTITEAARSMDMPNITLWQNLFKNKKNRTAIILI